MRKKLLVFSFISLLSAACATKTFVRQSVQQVEQRVEDQEQRTQQKIDALNAGLSQQQDRLAGTQEQVGRVETHAASAEKQAQMAQVSADGAHQRTQALELTLSNVNRQVVLSDRAQGFARNSARLSRETQAALDAFVDEVRRQQLVWIEIEGHTDNTGNAAYNAQLSVARAEVVRQYLASKGVPLHKMTVIGYGVTRPVAPNRTRDGRAQNRRVVVRAVR
mgnify:CR=1 FL=1